MADRITGTEPGRPDYGLDELVMSNVRVHIERMASGHVWIGIYRPDWSRVTVSLHSARTITAMVEDEPPIITSPNARGCHMKPAQRWFYFKHWLRVQVCRLRGHRLEPGHHLSASLFCPRCGRVQFYYHSQGLIVPASADREYLNKLGIKNP